MGLFEWNNAAGRSFVSQGQQNDRKGRLHRSRTEGTPVVEVAPDRCRRQIRRCHGHTFLIHAPGEMPRRNRQPRSEEQEQGSRHRTGELAKPRDGVEAEPHENDDTPLIQENQRGA